MSLAPISPQIEHLVTLLERGYLREAEACAQDMISNHPDSGYGWKILALAISGQGKDAVAEFRKAAQLLPNDHESQFNLGNALMAAGQPDAAIRYFQRALKLKPNDAQAHCGLGNANMMKSAFAAAEQCFRRALQAQPDSVLAHFNLGNAWQKLGRLQEAATAYRRAAELEPNFAQAQYNLGNALCDLGQPGQAVQCFRRAVTVNPEYLDAYSNLLHTSLLSGTESPAELLAAARRFGERAAAHVRPYTVWQNDRSPDRPLRIGLVSGDLRSHPVGFFIQGVLAALTSREAQGCDVYAYYNYVRTDAVSALIKACCRGWRSCAELSDEALAAKIHEDQIDILFDLAGHTAYSRLSAFARRPAPIQVAWLGYLGTTGVTAMDYLIADPWTLPESEEPYFVEKIWRLPETAVCLTPPQDRVPVAALPALRNDYVTFGSFNNLNKISDATVSLWVRVLDQTRNSRLLLKAKLLDDKSVCEGVSRRFAAHGLDPSRLILKKFAPGRAEHLADYGLVDIALDPFPHPGITSTVEALWMGVPVLTLAGERFHSRQGIGLLMNAGLPDWIAANEDEYVAKSAAFAADWDALAALRAGLRLKVVSSPLCDVQRFARHFEGALRAIWRRWLLEATSTG